MPVHQNIDCPRREPVPFFAASELRHGPFHERPVPVQFEHVQARPIFDEAAEREAWVVLIVAESEAADHGCELLSLSWYPRPQAR
jgi:hypothetical protein